MLDLGTVRPGSTIRIPFSSFDKDDGSSITMTNYAAADILVYKNGSTTERASTAGFTATTDFDTKTGKHLAVIDLADNTTADFWNAGAEYLVAIDAVTVDAVTTGGWIARFVIGYPNALLNTTIATLASQTSFTLTAGPAEDDALNGMWAVIHDIASAVQLAKVLISDYTGSTKTVTLAAGGTFTAAAGDNFSVIDLAPVQPTVTGRTLDVSTGGEAGIDWANVGSPTTAVNLSGTNIDTDQVVASVTGAVGSVTGNVGGNVTGSVGSVAANGIAATSIATGAITAAKFAASAIDAAALAADAVTEIQSGLATAAALATVDTVVDSILVDTAEIGAAGAGLTALATAANLATVAGYLDTEIAAVLADTNELQTDWVNGGRLDLLIDAIKAKTDSLPAAPAATGDIPTAAALADAVWDEAIAGHLGAGSMGEALNAAGAAGDPWTTTLPGAYGAGSAGFIIGNNIDAPISTVDTVVDAIKAKTDSLAFTVAGKVDSNIHYVNGVAVTGTGATGDEWGP